MGRFIVGILSEVERVDKQLHLFSDTLDEWLACQKEWMYLKTIFTAPDIQRQLPHEAKAFTAVDKQFREVMRRTRERNNAMQAATTPGHCRIVCPQHVCCSQNQTQYQALYSHSM